MSTWQEIREEVLVMLDVKKDAGTSSDIRSLVDIKLKRFRDRLYNLKFPASLLVSSSAATVAADTEAIKISGVAAAGYPSFGLSDYLKAFTLTMEGEDWEFVEWPTWVRSNHAIAGNQRPNRSFSIDYQNYIYLSVVPTGDEEWDAVLHYYKEPATIVDGGTPEIGAAHEELLAVGVALQFPNLFKTEQRLAIYGDLRGQYKELLQDYLRDRGIAKKDGRFRPYVRKRSQQSVIWGTGETS